MSAPKFDKAIQAALQRLEQELDPRLSYHSLWHTQKEVLPTVAGLATLLSVDAEATKLLEVAAAYHDLGFVIQQHDHEIASCQLAQQMLPQFCLAQPQIDHICDMIMATRLPQTPHNTLEALLADADLDVLGRADFLKRNHDFRVEMVAQGQISTDEQWYQTHLAFLQDHTYFTTAAIHLRQKGKEENIGEIKIKLKRCQTTSAEQS